MITEHFDAVKARLESHAGLVGKVFDTVRLDANGGLIRENYIVEFSPAPGAIVSDRLAMVADYSGPVPFDQDLRVVGTTASNVRLYLDRILGQVTGHLLVVPGRQPAPLHVTNVTEVTPDTSVKPFLYFSDVTIEWTSEPA